MDIVMYIIGGVCIIAGWIGIFTEELPLGASITLLLAGCWCFAAGQALALLRQIRNNLRVLRKTADSKDAPGQ